MLKLLVTISGLVPIVLLYVKKRKHDENLLKIQAKLDHYCYNFIFVTNDNTNCVDHIRKQLPCGENCSHNYLQTILNHLSSATTSIVICIYHVTLQSILKELSDAHKRNINVRIITDREMVHHSSSIIKDLRKIGILCKVQPDTSSLMHHKFFLIDQCTSKMEVWYGSLNLTSQGLTSNWDNMVYTNNSKTIRNFTIAFELMWNVFTDSDLVVSSK